MVRDPRIQKLLQEEYRKMNEEAKLELNKNAFFAAQNNIINTFIEPGQYSKQKPQE